MVYEIIVAFLGPLHLTRRTLSRPITPEGKNSFSIILVPPGNKHALTRAAYASLQLQ